jgi:hypothetical protein
MLSSSRREYLIPGLWDIERTSDDANRPRRKTSVAYLKTL